MRNTQRKFCHDVSVICNADCWTDHKLLRAKIGLQVTTSRSRGSGRHCFAIYQLHNANVCSAYNKEVLERIAPLWDENMSAVEKWVVQHDGLVDARSELLGRDCRRQPDWYKDSFDILQPLITSRNAQFAQWLQCKSHRNRQRYVDMRRTVTAAVRKAKNVWFQQKAKEIESKVQAGVISDAWKCVRDIQRGRAGLHPTKPKAVRNLNGDLCSTPAESL